MTSRFLASVATLALTTSLAMAADLPSRRAPTSDYVAPPVFSWSGFYVGLNAGYGWGSFSNGGSQLFGNPNGVQGGVTAGFNWQATPNVVLGLEGDFNLTAINNRQNLPFFGYSGKGSLDTLATVRGRVGYAADRALIYATGGLAMGSVSANVADWRFAPFFGSQSSFNAGWALGAGLEYAFTDKVSAKAEYLFTSLGSSTMFAYTPDWVTTGVNVSNVRMGVNYHF